MKRFLSSLLTVISVLSPVSAINPVTQAMMGVYDRLISENPKDYETLFRRANEYYKQGEYALALDDINSALRYVPVNNGELRAQCYSLRANIFLMQDNLDSAYTDFSSAIALNPEDYPSIYQKALIDTDQNRLAEARSGFKKLQKLNSRSADALFGLARVEIRSQNLGLANDLMNTAVDLDKTNSNLFLRRANLRKELGNNGGAVEDILIAISLDQKNHNAFKALTDMADYDYSAVVAGLSDVISHAPDNGMYYYIRATLALEHGFYSAAETDFEYIIKRNLYDYQGIFRSLALCQFNLEEYDKALANINHAISMTPDNAQYQVLKARILLGMGQKGKAVEVLQVAIEQDSENKDAIELLTKIGRGE